MIPGLKVHREQAPEGHVAETVGWQVYPLAARPGVYGFCAYGPGGYVAGSAESRERAEGRARAAFSAVGGNEQQRRGT